MRKLTGYIGAMIIVFALMGSVLAGYALNINGQSTVINDYEKITDVSGLYTHSEEKSYIEYNPASNYIGYSNTNDFYENTGQAMKKFSPGDSATINVNGTISFNGKNYTVPNADKVVMACSYGYLYSMPGNPGIYWTSANGDYGVSTITLTWTGTQITVVDNVKTFTANTGIAPYVYYPYDDYDYVEGGIRAYYHYTNPATRNDELLCIGNMTPNYLGNNIYISGSGWTSFRCVPNGTEADVSPNVPFVWQNDTIVDNGVNNGTATTSYSYGGSTFNLWRVIAPRYVYSDPVGDIINYTESNRVNNYLIEIENIGGTQTTTNQTLNLYSGMNLTDYATDSTLAGVTTKYWFVGGYTYSGSPFYAINYSAPSYTSADYNSYVNAIHKYKLLDILNFYNISTNQIITIRDGGGYQIILDGGKNTLVTNNITGFGVTGNGPSLDTSYPDSTANGGWLLYNPVSEIVEWYTPGGIKTRTDNINDVYVSFSDSSARYGLAYKNQLYPSEQTLYFVDYGVRQTPHIDISYTTITGGSTVYHYMDITKGVSINAGNVEDVLWDNEYENGRIQLLFRANDLNGTYQNTITVCGNDINIDYTNNRYYITLGADTVDIGTWRNIVLNIDLINGKLSAIPVRTFNSFTNVILDNSVVNIGDLIGATPTNTITWAPSSNSLMFTVYSTDVFLNTYGVVMVNPSLTIMDYFPDLGQFYRLKMYNFATYGDNITINGVTYPVSNGTITIDNKVVTLKNLYIEYADGDITVKDDHVEINTGAIVSDTVSMTGTWYFLTDLERGYTTQKMVYDWDWGAFIVDNTQFAVIYIGLLGVSLIVARRFCNLSITDYALMIVSVIIALSVQVIA